MATKAGRGWGQVVLGVLAVAGTVTLAVPSVEARARVRSRSSSSHSSAPSVGKSSVPLHASDASKPHVAAPAGPSVSVSMPATAPDNRGWFRRFWDSLFGRKLEPLPAPMVVQPSPGTLSLAGPAAPVASAGVSSAIGAAAGAAVGSQLGARAVAGSQQLQQGQPGAAAAGAALGASMTASLDHSSDKTAAEVQARRDRQASAATRGQEAARPKPIGYILHLHNGGSVSVADYEEKGDRVVVSTRVGSFGLHKMDIARIEPQYSKGR